MGVYLANLQQPLPSKEKLCEFYFPFGKKKNTAHSVELAQALVSTQWKKSRLSSSGILFVISIMSWVRLLLFYVPIWFWDIFF